MAKLRSPTSICKSGFQPGLHGPRRLRKLFTRFIETELKTKYHFSLILVPRNNHLFFYNEPELGVEIDPGMTLTPLLSSIGQGSNPRPSDRKPSALLLDHSFRLRNDH